MRPVQCEFCFLFRFVSVDIGKHGNFTVFAMAFSASHDGYCLRAMQINNFSLPHSIRIDWMRVVFVCECESVVQLAGANKVNDRKSVTDIENAVCWHDFEFLRYFIMCVCTSFQPHNL